MTEAMDGSVGPTLPGRVEAAADVIAARAADHDRDASLPAEGVAALWASGLGNLTLSRDRGGDGLALAPTARIVRRIGAADASLALVWVMHLAHLALVVDPAFGLADGVRDAIVASALRGPALINALRVEPELGTPARGGVPATTATRTTGGWRLDGHKIYCTGSHGLRWMLVWATVAEEARGSVGEPRVGPFVVDSRTPGIEIRDTWDHLGMRASASHDVVLGGVEIPADHHGQLHPPSGAASAGRDPVMIARMSVLLSSLYLGVATAARDRLVEYLHERVPTGLGASLATLPRFQAAVGEIETRLTASARLLDAIADGLDAGAERAARAAQDAGPVKTTVTRAVVETTQQAVALIGNPGLSRRLPFERHLRDALCSRIHTPQDDTILLAAGRRALDL